MAFDRLFRSTEEQIAPVEAQVTGTVPAWLDGTLVKVCPAIFELESGFVMNNFFDGYAVIVKFTIRDGMVEFSKRYLESDAYKKAVRYGKPAYPEFGTRAYSSPDSEVLTTAFNNIIDDSTDNCNMNVIQIGDTYFANKYTQFLRIINLEDLSTGDKIDIYPIFGYKLVSTLYKKDAVGDIYLIVPREPDAAEHEIIKIPAGRSTYQQAFKDVETICRMKSSYSLSIDFGITEHYIIRLDQPVIVENKKISKRIVNGKFLLDCLQWNPDMKVVFYVVEKSSGKQIAVRYESEETFYCFHFVNCYEEGQQIVIDVIGYDDFDVIKDGMLIKNLRQNLCQPRSVVKARRFVLPVVQHLQEIKPGENLVRNNPGCRAVRIEDKILLSHRMLCNHTHDMPTINERYFGLEYRYYYATGHMYRGDYEFSVIKVDCESGEVVRWYAGDGQVPSEAIFVEKRDCASEDDGVLLVCISSSLSDHADRLVMLDATNMQLIATAAVPCHLPITRRGLFINKNT